MTSAKKATLLILLAINGLLLFLPLLILIELVIGLSQGRIDRETLEVWTGILAVGLFQCFCLRLGLIAYRKASMTKAIAWCALPVACISGLMLLFWFKMTGLAYNGIEIGSAR